ncbi:unnamed protein product [Cylindrotheca closterium]|uniref:RING-type domain-containing protein n=1 Tax=Cylindrotheca closterium TaxID=2856 RepID=A0AAD2CH90_9STRA|nr:unnamed protein product [Cylindrotheca closterium]
MSEPNKCYLCGKPGKLEKLFRSCKHEPACHSCLRNCYVLQATHVCKYPLKCFHPECKLVVRNTQIERFVKTKEELQTYHYLHTKAKMHKVRLGDNWKEIIEILGEALGSIELCRCPKCKMLITKSGGCDHMTCVCGTEFNWDDTSRRIEEKCQVMEARKAHHNLRSVEAPSLYKGKNVPFLGMDDEDLFADCGSYSGDDDESSSTDVCAVDDTVVGSYDEALDLDSVPSDLLDSFPSLCLEAKEKSAVVSAASVEEVSVGTKTEWEQESFEVLELASNASDDSWTHFEDESESRSTVANDFQTSSQSTWEELSEVSSVVSFNSKTGISFLAVARAAPPNQESSNSWKEVSKAPKLKCPLKTITEHRDNGSSYHDSDADGQEHQGEMFDADFMFDGAKCGRGGKGKFMFKHQPKRKYHRYDQRQRSSARMRQY